MTSATSSDPTFSDSNLHRFALDKYQLRKQFFKLFGGAFRLYNENDELVLYSKQKSFKIREDIRLYSDEQMTTELLHISTQSILDISGTYAVTDSTNGELVGALKRAGLKSSFVRDTWTILDAHGQEIGTIEEDSTALALLRRYIELVSFLFPQKFSATIGGSEVAEFKQTFNPFLYRLHIDFSADTQNRLDPRLGLAAAVLLAAIEGKQD